MNIFDIFTKTLIKGNDDRSLFRIRLNRVLVRIYDLYAAVISLLVAVMSVGDKLVMSASIFFFLVFVVLFFITKIKNFNVLRKVSSFSGFVAFSLYAFTVSDLQALMLNSMLAACSVSVLAFDKRNAYIFSTIFVILQAWAFISCHGVCQQTIILIVFYVLAAYSLLFAMTLYDQIIITMVDYFVTQENIHNQTLADKREFITKLSHRIRTPLSNILGIGNILSESETQSGENKQLLESLVASVKNITDIVELIDGESVPKVSTVNAKDIVEFDLAELITKSAELTKGIEAKINIVGELPKFRANVVRIRRIFLAVFDFFVKYANDQQSVNLTINVNKVRIPATPTKYRFDISTPIAINIAEDENIEELEMAGRLVSSLQGNMKRRFDDESSFIYFNIVLDEVDGTGAPNQKLLEVHTKESEGFVGVSKIKDLSEARILICEDNPINQKVMTLSLEKHVDTIDLAFNGQEGVDLFKKKAYDIIVMDIQMPVLDGYAATKQIREIELDTKNHIPIIAITANTLSGDRDHCIQVGMDDYISKPFHIDDVLAKMSVLLKKYPQS